MDVLQRTEKGGKSYRKQTKAKSSEKKKDYSKTKQLISTLVFFKQEKSVPIHLLLKSQYAT